MVVLFTTWDMDIYYGGLLMTGYNILNLIEFIVGMIHGCCSWFSSSSDCKSGSFVMIKGLQWSFNLSKMLSRTGWNVLSFTQYLSPYCRYGMISVRTNTWSRFSGSSKFSSESIRDQSCRPESL